MPRLDAWDMTHEWSNADTMHDSMSHYSWVNIRDGVSYKDWGNRNRDSLVLSVEPWAVWTGNGNREHTGHGSAWSPREAAAGIDLWHRKKNIWDVIAHRKEYLPEFWIKLYGVSFSSNHVFSDGQSVEIWHMHVLVDKCSTNLAFMNVMMNVVCAGRTGR